LLLLLPVYSLLDSGYGFSYMKAAHRLSSISHSSILELQQDPNGSRQMQDKGLIAARKSGKEAEGA
jgi:hypothetical protein